MRNLLTAVMMFTTFAFGWSGQSPAAQKKPALALVLSLESTAGAPSVIKLAVTDLEDREWLMPNTRIHVDGPDGEPPSTLYQRQVTHQLLPGEPELMEGGFRPRIPIGEAGFWKYELTRFYILKQPGKYVVRVDAYDDRSEMLLRSNPVQFEIKSDH